MEITLHPDTLKAALTCAAKGDIRYYLNGVLVDVTAARTVLVATDGHVLLAVPLDPEDVTDAAPGLYILPREALESVKPCKAGRDALPYRLTITPARTEPDPERPGVDVKHPPTFALAGVTTAAGPCVDGIFPDWRRVMPATASGEIGQYQSAFIAAFGKVAQLLAGDRAYPVIHHNGINGGALVTMPGTSALGVIMPFRVDAAELRHPGLPAWARKGE